MDMSPAYISAVLDHLPKATIVFDHFHVIKLFNDKLSDLRRDLYRETKESLQKAVLKGTRWLLLKNPENLDPEKKEKERLAEALKLNEPLSCAYYLKEDLRQIWLQPNKEIAERVFTDWIKRAQATGIKMLKKFANTLAGYKSGILAYYDYRISSGPLEAGPVHRFVHWGTAPQYSMAATAGVRFFLYGFYPRIYDRQLDPTRPRHWATILQPIWNGT